LIVFCAPNKHDQTTLSTSQLNRIYSIERSFTMSQQQDSQQGEGGYPCDMFVTPPPGDLVCNICTDVLRDPLQVCSEHHTYFRGCITEWRAKDDSCPECRVPFIDEQPARLARNMILQLTVRCPHTRCNERRY
jgi:hypothetical protein